MRSAPWLSCSVLITGHTGFKGAWLAAWLRFAGANVTGFALSPTDDSLWSVIGPCLDMQDVRGDVRDLEAVEAVFARSRPEVVFHLAAQSLVRVGYREPIETIDVNVRGTAVILEAALRCPAVRAVVVITSDKVYNVDVNRLPYSETSLLGGSEPYGASKACSEIVVNAYRESFFRSRGLPLATARAGNVIGGGDWAPERLVPDAARMLDTGCPVVLRYPDAVRPWQHVLDPLNGYLLLAERMLSGSETAPKSLNFGPSESSCVAVSRVVDILTSLWGGKPGWVRDTSPNPPEAPALTLSSALATAALGWRPVLELDQALEWTASWYAERRQGGDVASMIFEQIRKFEELAS